MNEQDSAPSFDAKSLALLVAAGGLLALATVPGFPTLTLNAFAVVLWFASRLKKRPVPTMAIDAASLDAAPLGGHEVEIAAKAPASSASPVEKVLARWRELFDRGVDPSAEDLCKECPALTEAVKAAIRSLKAMIWVEPTTTGDLSMAETLPTGTDVSFLLPLEGRYRMDKCIGKGGNGEVWLAFDLELQRLVAVKVPKTRRRQPSNDEGLLDEARKLAKLRHPGIIQVHDVGRVDGMLFIVSDFIDGEDLAALMTRKQLSVRESVRIVAEAARSLQYAHEHGFIHRDIKPANILIDRHSKVYLADFGIAATSEQLRLQGDDGRGTLAYMSPEQLHGDPSRINHRSDLYGLGVVLYELLTGQHPFAGKSRAELQQCVLTEKPAPPRSVNRRIPREVDRICVKCLYKSPFDRYASAAEFADALAHSQRSRWRWHANAFIGAALLVVVGFLGAGASPLEPKEAAQSPKQAEVRTIASNVGATAAEDDTKVHEDLGKLASKRAADKDAAGRDVTRSLPPDNEWKRLPHAAGLGTLLVKLSDVLVSADYEDLTESEREIARILIRDGLLHRSEEGLLEGPRVAPARLNCSGDFKNAARKFIRDSPP